MLQDKQLVVGDAIEEFVGQIESLANSLPLAMLAIQGAYRVAFKSYEEFVQKHCEKQIRDDDTYIVVPFEHNDRYTVLNKRVQQTSTAYSAVPRSFQVSLVSSYDAFLGNLVSALFRNQA